MLGRVVCIVSPRIDAVVPPDVRGGRGSFSAGSETDRVIENVCDMVSLPMRERVAAKAVGFSPESRALADADEGDRQREHPAEKL